MRHLAPEDVDTIVVHCSAGSADATADDIRRYHTADPPDGRGWDDTGYHLLINQAGELLGGRPMWYQGAHARGFNDRSIAICLIGHYDPGHDELTPAMWSKLVEVCHAMAAAYQVDPQNIVGHRETYDRLGQQRLKTCPGMLVDLGLLRREVSARMSPLADVAWAAEVTA